MAVLIFRFWWAAKSFVRLKHIIKILARAKAGYAVLEDGDYLGSGLSHPVHNTDEKLLTELERLKERAKQLYEASVMLKTGQIDLALFGEF